jgi:hypothetical protein
MKKLFLVLFFFSVALSTECTFAQEKVYYTIKAEANALMCPFLSPQLMEKLTKSGAVDVKKDEKLQLHFWTTKETEFSDEFILKMVEDIGYQSSNFSVERSHEN